MLRFDSAKRAVTSLVFLLCALAAGAQPKAALAAVQITVVDENGLAVPGAQVTVEEPGLAPLRLWTDYAGQCTFTPQRTEPYQLNVQKPNFYQAHRTGIDPSQTRIRVTMAHEQIVKEQVNVTASPPGIDTQQIASKSTMNTPEIVNIPYQTSRDIRYLLPFNPGVVQDSTDLQVHVDGSATWETLDTLDGFDIRSPATGTLDMRVSADAVRTMEVEDTRYPVQFGGTTGGVIAFYTGMGDNKFRANATNFIPSFRDQNGIRFDQFVPRFTFSGPLKRNRAWWYDGADLNYSHVYIPELPANASTGTVIRGSNLAKAQWNATSSNIVTAGLLFNDYHSPQSGLSALVPIASTTNQDIIAWLPYLREQFSFHNGALLDAGVAQMRFRDGQEPHGDVPYEITPEQAEGSNFENQTGRSERWEGTATLYLPPRRWAGRHDLQAGADVDHITYNQNQLFAPVSYLRQDGTLDRKSVFAPAPAFTLHNAGAGAYFEDRWQPAKGWLVEPGLRFDWDEIVRRPLFSPRIAAVYAPPASKGDTKISAGIGLYYDHTQLDYLTPAFEGVRYDTYYEADGTTPAGPAQMTQFTVHDSSLRDPRAVNWSVGAQQKLPGAIFVSTNFVEKRTTGIFTFANQSGAAALAGDYLLTNARVDRYNSEEFDFKKVFAGQYPQYVSYTHSSARTNAALDYLPTPSPLGPQQSGPLAWDAPDTVITWGWLPAPVPKIKKHWNFVYLLNWRSGFPYTAENAAGQVVGAAGAQRFPHYIEFSPGLEWKFHFHGQYWGLRGVMENATDSMNPAVVNNDVDSPEYGTFSEPQGRAFTARIRLIGSSK